MPQAEVPEVRFSFDDAYPIYPRPQVKNAALVHIPLLEEGGDLPTFIRPEWGGVQVFYGDYYAIVKDGEVIYGSAKEQWEAMHTETYPGSGSWIKTAVPLAYRASEACRIVTLIPDESGAIKEASFVLKPQDWIVRQPGGEVQHIKAEKYPTIYFTPAEAVELGLTQMSATEFADWATYHLTYA
ncbi:MAG: hypothetical protein WAQ27_03065 [Candidatus Microsaccharimonas sp.]